MAIDLDKLSKAIDEAIESGEFEAWFKEHHEEVPQGWVSIEDHLPKWMGMDVAKGYSEYRVKDKDGNEGISYVTDHTMWYYRAKDQGITHWYNEA